MSTTRERKDTPVAERPQALLRLEPHTIPALITAFDRAIKEMTPLMLSITLEGRMPEPWLHDETSVEIFNLYHWFAMGDGSTNGSSAFGRLRAYEAELIKVRDTLQRMDEDYRRTEDERAALFGRGRA